MANLAVGPSLAPSLRSGLITSVMAVAVYISSLCMIFEPRWETNDDIAMSMVAHGYGLAAVSSPNLVFSNVIWGYLIRTIPDIDGLLGYSTATLAALLTAGVGILYFLQRLGVGKCTAAVATFAVLLRPVIFPQFTLTAGFLTLAAILGFWAYLRSNEVWMLITATILVDRI